MIAAILALAGVFMLAPGGAALFDGLPVDGPAEFLAAAALLVLAISPSARAALAARTPAFRRLLLALVVAGLLAKAVVIGRGRYEGFLGCYEGAVARVTSCAVSYDNPFRLQRATRIDPRLQFDERTWRLGLLNKREYDFARDNSPAVLGRPAVDLIDHPITASHYVPNVPFAAEWRSTLTATAAATLRVRYVGEGSVDIDGTMTVLPAHIGAEPAVAEIQVPAGPHQLVVTYHWAPSVDPSLSVPEKALMWLDASDGARFGSTQRTDAVARTIGDVLGIVAFGLLIGGGWPSRSVRAAAGAIAVALLIAVLPMSSWWRDKLVELTTIVVCLQWILRRMPILPFVLLLAALGMIRVGLAAGPAPGVVHYRAWGDDGLSYDSFAREIFEKGTLRAGEDSFRGQALFRYVRFVERVAMGEDEWLIVVCALVLFCLAYSWLARRALEDAPGHLFFILSMTALLLWIMGGLIAFVDSGLTEYPAWILLPVSTGLLFLGRSSREHLLAAALAGAGVLLRFNHLPAWMLLLAFFALRPTVFPSSRKTVAAALALFALVVCVPMLAHNLYYGHQWRIIPESAQVNTDLPPSAFTVSSVLEKVRYLLHVGTDARTAFLPLHALQLILVGVAAAVFAGRWHVRLWHRWLFAAPLAALAVHLVFNVNVYYPRHILFAYLLAGAIALVLAAEDGASARRVEAR
jgi:hypothetical protein